MLMIGMLVVFGMLALFAMRPGVVPTTLSGVRDRLAAITKEKEAILDKVHNDDRKHLSESEDARFNELDLEQLELTVREKNLRGMGGGQTSDRRTFASSPGDGRSASYNSNASGRQSANASELDYGGFESVHEVFSALYQMSRNERMDARLDGLRRMAAAADPGGGAGSFAIPMGFVVRAYDEVPMDYPLLSNCDRVPMDALKARIPLFSDDSHGTAPYGISWQIIPESGSFGDPQVIAMKSLDLHNVKHGAYFSLPNEWLNDANPTIRAKVENIFTTSLRWYMEDQLWTGNGVAGPLGALVSPATLEIAKEANQAADTIVHNNIAKAWASLRPGSHARSRWACNQTTLPQLLSMTLASGTGGFQSPLVTTTGNTGTSGLAIMGRPCDVSEHLPVLGDSGDIVVYDPALYVLGDRQQILVDVSPHIRFQNDETAYRVSTRFTGSPALSTTFTPANGDACGWAVKIAAR